MNELVLEIFTPTMSSVDILEKDYYFKRNRKIPLTTTNKPVAHKIYITRIRKSESRSVCFPFDSKNELNTW